MAYTVALPDGRTVEFPDSVSREQAAEIIRKQLGAQTPKEGLIAGFQKGAESTLSQMRSGLGALVGSGDEAAKAGLARGEDIGQRYAQQVSMEKVKQAYADKGLLSAAGEVIGQIPYAISEQLPNLATNIGGARLGALAGSPFGPVGSLIGGGVGLIAPSVLQALGGDVERQAAEGQPVSVGKALPAAALQGGLDIAGSFIPLGGKLVSKLTGLPVEALLGRTSTQITKLADERLLATLVKGTGTGALAEIPTEVAQQMIERAQAGLSLSSPDALKEYGETAYQAGLLGPIGAVGRYSQRSDAQDIQAKERRAQEVELVKQQNVEAERVKAEQEAYKQTPNFLKDINQRYEALQTQLKELDTRASVKPDKNDLAAQADVREARQERDALKKTDETQQLVADYRGAEPRIKAMREDEEQAQVTAEGMKTQGAQADLFGAPTVQDQTPLAQLQALAPRIKDLDAQIKAAQKAGDTQQLATLGNQRQQLQNTIQPLLPTRVELTDSRAALERYLEDSRGRMKTAEKTADIERHAQQAQQYKQALEQLDQYEPYVKAAPNFETAQKKLKELQGSLTKARELGDQDQVLKILPKLRELEGQVEKPLFYEDAKNLQRLTKEGKYPEPQEPYKFRGRQYVKDFFDYDEIISDKELADEMSAGRDRAKQLRESLEAESAKLRGFAERKGARTPAEQALFDMRTEEARKLRDQFAEGEQDWSKLDKSPEDTQYQQDRVDLQKKLKERVVNLQMELDRAPEAPAEADTFEKEMAAIKDRVLAEGDKPPRFKSAVQKELEVTQQSLANLESRIAIGERYRKRGDVADNIITKETDKNIADLLDRLLPGAIKPPQGVPAPAPRRVSQLPIQSAQDQLTRLKEAQALLKSLNKQIQAAGKPKDPAKIEALDALKDQRKDVQQEIAAAQKAYDRLVELEQPSAAPKVGPTQGDLFGGLEESKVEINALDKKLGTLYNDLKLAQAEANRLGAEPETPQLKALVEKFQKRPSPRVKEIQTEIERLESRRESATGERSQQYVDYLKQRAEETGVPEGQRTFDKRLSGLKEEILKPVAKEELDTARTKYVELQSTIEGIRAALSKQDSDGGKSLREVATNLQLELENKTQEFGGTFGGFGKKSTVTEAKAKAIQDEYAPRIKRLLNMASMAAAAKKTGAVPTALQTALNKAQADQVKAKATYDALESKQRAYEQQQAVITGSTPGKAEAERLLAGEGYRNVAGFVRTTPKKKESWGITSVPKAKVVKPTEVAKAAAEVEKAASLVKAAGEAVFKETRTTVMTAEDKAEKEETLKNLRAAQKAAGGDTDPNNPAVALRNKLAKDVAEAYATERATKTTPIVPAAIAQAKNKINRLQTAVDVLDPQANETFSPEKSTEVYTEIQDLQEEIGRFGTQEQFDGLSTIIKGIDVARAKKGASPGNLYVAPFKRYESMMRNAEAQVDALDAKLNQLKAEYDTIAKNEGEKAPVVVEADLADVIARATPVDKSHTKAVLAYKIARRDMLAYQYEMGKDVREQYRAAVQALQAEVERQGKDATLPAAIKERDAAVAKLKETQDRLAAAETKLREAQGKARGEARAAETLAPTEAQKEEKVREERRQAILRGEPTELQNLPALRVERDTTTPLAQAVQNNAKRMLGLSRAALESATNAKDREEATLAVQRYERELAQAFEVGERKVTATGEYAGKADTDEDIFETQKPVPGERLGARKEGPLVRKARQAPGQFLGAALDVKQGSQNPPRQAGAIKLRASDLNPESANAISLVTLKGKLDAAKDGTKRKTTLEAQYKLATEGLTDGQIKERMEEGQRLMASGETLEVIAANEKRREARLELIQAESYLRTAKTPAAKEIAQDDVDTKQATYDAADRKYDAAKTAAASQGFKGTERADVQAADAVEEDLTSTPQSRLGKAFEDSEDSDQLATIGSATATPLSTDALGELYNGSLIYSLNEIAKSSPHQFIRDNATKLAQFIRKTKVEIVPKLFDKNGKSIPAAYNPVTNTVLLTKAGLNENDVIHEATHAATMSTIVLPNSELKPAQLAAKRELIAIFNKMSSIRRFKNEYALENLKEFVSEVQSNPELRQMMDKQPWYKGTMFEGFINALLRFIGVTPADINSAKVSGLIDQLYMQSRTFTAEQSRQDVGFDNSEQNVSKLTSKLLKTAETKPKVFYFKNATDLKNTDANIYDKIKEQIDNTNAVYSFGKLVSDTGLSRRQFLKGAGAAVGAMKLPAVEQAMDNEQLVDAIYETMNNGGEFLTTLFENIPNNIKGLLKNPKYYDEYIGDAFDHYGFDVSNRADMMEALYNQGEDWVTQDAIQNAVEERGVEALKEFQNIFKTAKRFLAEDIENVMKEQGIKAATPADPTLVVFTDKVANPIQLVRDVATQMKNLGAPLPVQTILENENVLIAAAARIESAFVGTSPGKWDTFKGNLFGLAGRVQLVDRLAAADKAIVEAEGAGKLTSTEAFQTQYFMRTADQTTQGAGQFITYGPVKIVSEQRSTGTEYRYQSESGANLVNMAEYLDEAAKAGGLNSQEAERMLTSIIAGERAMAIPNGWARLQAANPAAAKVEYERDVAYLKANPKVHQSMDAAKAEYKKVNDGLIDFVTQCGAISKEDAAIFKGRPFIPFYRVDNDVVKLFTDSEHAITIGNIKDSPDLQRMLGDNKHILPIMTSAAQNIFMLTRMGLQNQATKTTADAMFKAGFATKIGKGSGPANVNTVHYKIDGKPAFAVIDADTFGIPAHLIVKGMEGIKTTIPALVQMMGVPADILRKFVTRSPAYVVRQLIRDPVNASLLAGVDGVPMLNALKELSNMRAGRSEAGEALMRGLAVSSNVYSGNEKDMQKFLQDIASGKGKWEKMLGWLDTMALQADAATRATIYQDSLNKGLSEAQAQFRALESQNFSRRGLSPSMQMLSTMIPFFNAQVQGLDVLYRSLRGRMPFSERLDIQRKIVARGVMLTTVSLAYALAMQDDEAYKKASPEERYNNFFVRIPGVKDPLKIPIPYEAGLLFKALPEAILDVAMRDTKAKEAVLGMCKLILQSAPGVIPIGGKPLLEAAYGQTAFGPIESVREKQLQAAMRYRETTTELAKVMGSATGVVGVSPLMLEHLVRGYTGSLGIAAMHMLDPLLRSSSAGQKPSLSAAQLPFVGGLFQKEEGRWLIDRAYDRMDEVVQAQKTFEDLITRGQGAEARAFAQKFSNKLALADDAGSLRKEMGELYSMERAIRVNAKLTTEQKDLRIEQLKKLQNKLAEQFTTAVDRTTRQ